MGCQGRKRSSGRSGKKCPPPPQLVVDICSVRLWRLQLYGQLIIQFSPGRGLNTVLFWRRAEPQLLWGGGGPGGGPLHIHSHFPRVLCVCVCVCAHRSCLKGVSSWSDPGTELECIRLPLPFFNNHLGNHKSKCDLHQLFECGAACDDNNYAR